MSDDINKKLEKMINKDRKEIEEKTNEFNDDLLENDLRNLINKNFKTKALYTNIKKIKAKNDEEKYEIKINFITEKEKEE